MRYANAQLHPVTSIGRGILRSRQAGMSIVELMVALTIGLFLMLVVANLFIGSKQTYRNQDNMSRLQENGRFAISILGKSIREAGYHTLTFNPLANMYQKNTNINSWPYSATVLTGSNGTSGAPDSISLSADNTVDCLNASVTSPATNQYAINSSSQLTCKSMNSGTTGVLLDGVEDLQILYGESLGTTRRFVDASDSTINWGNVDTVRVCVLLRTVETGLTVSAQSYTDCSGNTGQTKADGRIRQSFSETFAVRSRFQ
ncbi:MAG TPA: PilW family protein [Burkholderiaceae bacterium]